MLTARTLAEAQIYFGLMRVTGPGTPDLSESTLAGTTRVEGEQAWTLTYDMGVEGRIQVQVLYGTEDVARRIGVIFGLGVSPLVDAGQWTMIAGVFARRAIDRDFSLAGGVGTARERERVELDWEYAAEAQGEAVKFLADGADALPREAFWSELGERALAEHPEIFTPAEAGGRLRVLQRHARRLPDDARAPPAGRRLSATALPRGSRPRGSPGRPPNTPRGSCVGPGTEGSPPYQRATATDHALGNARRTHRWRPYPRGRDPRTTARAR